MSETPSTSISISTNMLSKIVLYVFYAINCIFFLITLFTFFNGTVIELGAYLSGWANIDIIFLSIYFFRKYVGKGK